MCVTEKCSQSCRTLESHKYGMAKVHGGCLVRTVQVKPCQQERTRVEVKQRAGLSGGDRPTQTGMWCGHSKGATLEMVSTIANPATCVYTMKCLQVEKGRWELNLAPSVQRPSSPGLWIGFGSIMTPGMQLRELQTEKHSRNPERGVQTHPSMAAHPCEQAWHSCVRSVILDDHVCLDICKQAI